MSRAKQPQWRNLGFPIKRLAIPGEASKYFDAACGSERQPTAIR
jgi:hypothetical protein